MMMSSLCFSESVHKTCQRQPTDLKLGKLIVHSKFHKIGKFENHVTRNDVIMMSLTKTMEKQWEKRGPLRNQTNYIYQSKGIDESCPKMYFLLNLSHYVKSCGHFCQILAFFTMPTDQIWSYHVTQEANFKNFLFCPNSTFNIRKSHKISSRKVEKLSTSEIISQKLHGEGGGGVENTPLSACRAKANQIEGK